MSDLEDGMGMGWNMNTNFGTKMSTQVLGNARNLNYNSALCVQIGMNFCIYIVSRSIWRKYEYRAKNLSLKDIV